jgi:TPR repeat protein
MSDRATATELDICKLRQAARAGQREAQLLLAQAAMEGRGMTADPAEAFHWYSLAANRGEPMAMNQLGRCHELGQGTGVDTALAAVWYRKAAEAGLDWGMYNLAHLLASGNGIARNRAAAYRWYLQAAHLGHAGAMNFVGRFQEEGWEVAPGTGTAMAWYRRSAQGGDVRGQANYASMLANRGRITEATEWLKRALRTGRPAFTARLRRELAASPHPPLRALAETPELQLPESA